MGSNGVVVVPPSGENASGVVEAGKPVFVEALVAEFAVEALDVRVLSGFPGCDENDAYSVSIGPLVKVLASEFGTVVDEERLGSPMEGDELIGYATDTQPG
jgi:hypothetical protein